METKLKEKKIDVGKVKIKKTDGDEIDQTLPISNRKITQWKYYENTKKNGTRYTSFDMGIKYLIDGNFIKEFPQIQILETEEELLEMTEDNYNITFYVKDEAKRLFDFSSEKITIDGSFKTFMMKNKNSTVLGFMVENESFNSEFAFLSVASSSISAIYNSILSKIKNFYSKLFPGEEWKPKIVIDMGINILLK